jgi:hypothetical protein
MLGAQDSEAGDLEPFERFLAACAAQPVFAITEEREVLIDHPREQRAGFVDFARVEFRLGCGQCIGGLVGGRLHRLPIGACGAHIVQIALDLEAQRTHARLIDDAVDFDMLKRLQTPVLVGAGVFARANSEQLAGAVA